MGHRTGIRSPFALLALLALVVLSVVVALLFGIAAVIGPWAYPVFGITATYIFCGRMDAEQVDCIALSGCGGIAGCVAAWSASAIGGVGGAIGAMFIGAMALCLLVIIAMSVLHWD